MIPQPWALDGAFISLYHLRLHCIKLRPNIIQQKMSFGGQFDPESELRIQEEIRRRQMQQPQPGAAAAAYAAHLGIATDPYSYGRYPYDAYAETIQRARAAAVLQQQQGLAGYHTRDPRWVAAVAAANHPYGASPYYAAREAAAYLDRSPPPATAAAAAATTTSAEAASTPVETPLSTPSAVAATPGEEGDGEEHEDDDIRQFITYTKSGKPRKQRSPRVKELQELRTIMKKSVLHQHRQVNNEILDENNERKWFTGCVPLGLPDDKYWLSELQVYLRANFAEAFGATEDDIAAPMHGRNKPIALGQVGIRCMHCKNDNPAERGQQSTSYPSQISGIYNSVQQMLRLHYDCCLSMPAHVRSRIEQLRLSCSSRGGRKQYWIDSAKRLGLVDTAHGIHFERDPAGPLPPMVGNYDTPKSGRKKKEPAKLKPPPEAAADTPASSTKKQAASPVILERPPQPPPDARPLVFPNDKQLISDYLYLTLEQMAPCNLMEADRVGCYKNREIGFPGLACRHCVGQAGSGRYFPASEASLSQTTTSQTIMNHVRNCRRCPIEIRENLEIMKRSRMGPDGKRADKPKHGGRKVFFHRLWCRIQDIPFEEGKAERKETKAKKSGSGKRSKGKRKKKSPRRKSSLGYSDDSGTETEEDSESEDELESEEDAKPKAKPRKPVVSAVARRKPVISWHHGTVSLSKPDDSHWLGEMETHVRKNYVEVFSLTKNDKLDGYGGRKEPAIGQVGIRCIFCAKADPSQRHSNCIAFPDMLSSIHSKIKDMIRLHWPNCPNMPEKERKTWKTMKEYEPQSVGHDDAAQYWVDAARDLGLANIPPGGMGIPGAWGVTFRRDPTTLSPADQLDADLGEDATWGKNFLVRPADRGLCTDYVLLLLCQVRPCRFRKSDRRAGPGSRGRDRAMGFPGLACMHCSNKNSLGRYFPVSAKNLTDNTANSLQAHISSCSRCPEHIQASLAYLSHRSILQKAELSGSWKKAFFKKVWDRLHLDRTWTAIEDDDEQGAEMEDESVEDEMEEEDDFEDEEGEEEEEGGAEAEDDDSETRDLGDQMNALIRAAAIWLTEQDDAQDAARQGKSSKGRTLPSKRKDKDSSSGGSKAGRTLPTSKRRRTGA